ncbi:MAG TPA: beta-hydroxyacyl-ACP dehydratase [Planctomycetes bacterium]|nr:beta-hydroxyacyl-ACP dehydratase [Planctomycetota bacterium]
MRWFWIDRFLEFQSGKYAKAVKNISLAEDHLHDHFPGYPVMPNSLVVEGLAQTGGLLVCQYTGFQEKVILAKIPRVVFHFEARPGDTLIYSATVENVTEDGAMVKATSRLGDRIQAEMEVVFAYLDGQFQDKMLFDPVVLQHMMRILRVYEVGCDAEGKPLGLPPALAVPPAGT